MQYCSKGLTSQDVHRCLSTQCLPAGFLADAAQMPVMNKVHRILIDNVNFRLHQYWLILVQCSAYIQLQLSDKSDPFCFLHLANVFIFCVSDVMAKTLKKVHSCSSCGNHYVAGFEPRLVPLSKALYHTCFICGQRCKWWSRLPKLTSLVISDVKPIIYIL